LAFIRSSPVPSRTKLNAASGVGRPGYCEGTGSELENKSVSRLKSQPVRASNPLPSPMARTKLAEIASRNWFECLEGEFPSHKAIPAETKPRQLQGGGRGKWVENPAKYSNRIATVKPEHRGQSGPACTILCGLVKGMGDRASSKGWRAQWETDPPGKKSESP
jgi:hypothetical protein